MVRETPSPVQQAMGVIRMATPQELKMLRDDPAGFVQAVRGSGSRFRVEYGGAVDSTQFGNLATGASRWIQGVRNSQLASTIGNMARVAHIEAMAAGEAAAPGVGSAFGLGEITEYMCSRTAQPFEESPFFEHFTIDPEIREALAQSYDALPPDGN